MSQIMAEYLAARATVEKALPNWGTSDNFSQLQEALNVLIQCVGVLWLDDRPELREPPEQILHCAGFRSDLDPKVHVSYSGRDLWFSADKVRALIRACQRPINIFLI